MIGYSKELIINAFLHRFREAGCFSDDQINSLKKLGEDFYDKVGKETFRKYASVTPQAVSEYKEFIKNYGSYN